MTGVQTCALPILFDEEPFPRKRSILSDHLMPKGTERGLKEPKEQKKTEEKRRRRKKSRKKESSSSDKEDREKKCFN